MSSAKQSTATPSYDSQVVSGIRLAPQFVNRLCVRLETAHAVPDGVSGLLFGACHDDLVAVQAFRSLMDSDIAAIEAGALSLDNAVVALARAAQADPALAPLDLIGWYAFRPLGGLHDADVAFHKRQFQSMLDVALIVRRADAGSLLFEFYTRSRAGLLTEREHRWGASRLFPYQSVAGPIEIALLSRPGSAEATRINPAVDVPEPRRGNLLSVLHHEQRTSEPAESVTANRRLITAGDSPNVPAVVQPPLRRSAVPWFSSAILFALAAGVTFAFFVLHGLPSADSGSFWRSILPDTGLNLRVEGQGERVLLSWNRRNALVRDASGGVLKIDDGGRHRDVRLDAAQVQNGAVLYRPNSDDVSFRLEVRAQNGRTTAENLRVLDSAGRVTQPLDVSAGSTPVTPAPAPRPESSTPSAATSNPHFWQRISGTSNVDVPAPPPARLEAPLNAKATSATKFDLSVLSAAPAASDTAPAAAVERKPPPGSAPERTATEASANQLGSLPIKSTLPQSLPAAPKPIPAEPKPIPAAPTPSSSTRHSGAGGQYTPPRPLREILPEIAQLPPSVIASTGQIEVVVTVDKLGRVAQARAQDHGRTPPPAMTAAALNAARQWLFEPARLDGRTIPSEHTIVFQFGGK